MICKFNGLVGMVVFLLIRVVISPPAVSIPMERGATFSKSRSLTTSEVSPALTIT